MSDLSPEQLEAVQIVVDRVGGYQDGATSETVERELRSGLAEAEVELGDRDVAALVEAIESGDGTVDAASTLT